jgi:hypothetical protein
MATSYPSPGTSSQSTLSEYAGPYVTEMLGKTQAIANQPYSVYQGPMTAGESGLQSKMFQGLGNLNFPSNLGDSFSSATAPTIGANNQPMGGGIAGNYMNPYLQSVLNPQLDELQRRSQMNLQPDLAKLTQAGGYGGGRQAIMQSEAARNLLQEQNKTVGQGYANAYDKAMQQFNTEQGQAKTLADLMGQAGTAQRGIEQEGITADYNEFLAQRDYPQKMLQFQQSMLQGLPISTVSTSPASQTGLGSLQSTVGTLGSTYDLLKKLKVID